jgi:pyruvate dehydrogenase E1 component
VGGTAGRTTLAGEGLQHQDGHSHLLAYAPPTLKAYDPAYAFELAVIVKDGLRRMFERQEDLLYYITVMNEFYNMPPMPAGAEEGILKGLYKFSASAIEGAETKAHLMGSGTLVNEALRAAEMLENEYGVAADVWSVTSYKELYNEAMDTERWNMLHFKDDPRRTYLEQRLGTERGVFVAVSDYLKTLPASIARWIPGQLIMLGTDGFGRSDNRAALRDFFEVDARYICLAALHALARDEKIKPAVLEKAIKDLGIDPDKINPLFS